ncbi:MAG: TIGR03032 family protein [Paracoccaceae bacterium]
MTDAAPTTDAAAAPDAAEATVTYSMSGGFAALLGKLDAALAVTSYQSNLLYLIGRKQGGGAHVHQTALRKPMGLHAEGRRLIVAAGSQLLRFEDVLEPGEVANGVFDALMVPRTINVTGALDAHDIGLLDDGSPVFVATRFNCLATTSERHSFRPLWRPPFVTALVDEDRCHLNGLAMDGTRPAFVTAVSRSDTIDGWRDRRASGGVVVDVDTGEIACEGLSMPHSPRLHDGRLWVLNSGTGELGWVEGGTFHPLAFCPGFTRGLAFAGGFAFVGLSRPRYKRFEGLDLDRRLREADSEPWTGIQAIDLSTGRCAEWFRIDGKVAELYDVALMPGVAQPMSVGPTSAEAAKLVTIDRSA